MKRKFEVFTCDCPLCNEKVEEIKAASCDNCEIEILDIGKDKEALAKAKAYGIKFCPSVVLDGKLAECCLNGGIDIEVLKRLGLGNPN